MCREARREIASGETFGFADTYVLHAERDEQLAEVGLDLEGITNAAIELARTVGLAPTASDSFAAGGTRAG